MPTDSRRSRPHRKRAARNMAMTNASAWTRCAVVRGCCMTWSRHWRRRSKVPNRDILREENFQLPVANFQFKPKFLSWNPIVSGDLRLATLMRRFPVFLLPLVLLSCTHAEKLDLTRLKLPPGFHIAIFAHVPHPRMMVFSPGGVLL